MQPARLQNVRFLRPTHHQLALSLRGSSCKQQLQNPRRRQILQTSSRMSQFPAWPASGPHLPKVGREHLRLPPILCTRLSYVRTRLLNDHQLPKAGRGQQLPSARSKNDPHPRKAGRDQRLPSARCKNDRHLPRAGREPWLQAQRGARAPLQAAFSNDQRPRSARCKNDQHQLSAG